MCLLGDVEHTHDDTDEEIIYNGWYEDLLSLSEDMGGIIRVKDQNPSMGLSEVIELLNENKEDLWEHGLGSTFQCVIIEDVQLGESDDDDDDVHLYNGWYDKLKSFID